MCIDLRGFYLKVFLVYSFLHCNSWDMKVEQTTLQAEIACILLHIPRPNKPLKHHSDTNIMKLCWRFRFMFQVS